MSEVVAWLSYVEEILSCCVLSSG